MTIYVSNWSSHKTPGHHGPGRKLTIMTNPRHWERGEGRVAWLCPHMQDLQDIQSGAITVEEYERRYRKWVGGMLHAAHGDLALRAGDTLCCACSRQAAAEGRCHRVWAADVLVGLGFDVVLDGRRLSRPAGYVASIDLVVHLDELAARLEHSEGLSRAAAETTALDRCKAELRDRVGPYRNEVGMYAAMDAVRHAHGWNESVEALVGLTRAIEVCETKGGVNA